MGDLGKPCQLNACRRAGLTWPQFMYRPRSLTALWRHLQQCTRQMLLGV